MGRPRRKTYVYVVDGWNATIEGSLVEVFKEEGDAEDYVERVSRRAEEYDQDLFIQVVRREVREI